MIEYHMLRNALSRSLPVKALATLLAVLGSTFGHSPNATAQDPANAAEELHRSVLERARRIPAPILVVGTYHFEGSTTDDSSAGDMNMLSARRQTEIEEVLGMLEDFKPTVVAVEAPASEQVALDNRYREFLAGNGTPDANEVYQLGFRLAKQCGLKSVSAVDAPGRWLEPRTDLNEYARSIGQQEYLADPYDAALIMAGRRRDELLREFSLRDGLLLLNHPTQLRDSAAMYLVEKLAVSDGETYHGADGFVSQWYNRNLRIYGNLLRLVTPEETRVVLIIGIGHVPILRHLFDSSLHFHLVDVSEILGRDSGRNTPSP